VTSWYKVLSSFNVCPREQWRLRKSTTATPLSNNLKGAKSIGATIEKRLNEIGVFSLTDLAQMTAVKAYQSICKQNPDKIFPVCYYLYLLQGVLLDLHWDDLPAQLKAELLNQVGRKEADTTNRLY
jgi:DNA transformation protein